MISHSPPPIPLPHYSLPLHFITRLVIMNVPWRPSYLITPMFQIVKLYNTLQSWNSKYSGGTAFNN